MSEKDKMLSNEWYDANYDEDLLKERLKAQDLCHDFNILSRVMRNAGRKYSLNFFDIFLKMQK